MSGMIQRYTEFPSIIKQAKAIGYLYKLFGLYSIILLTIVTIISMTNVFTSGEFARWTFIQGLWAFIFALAIDVNIVRLFMEARIEHSKGAYTIGLGLAGVTGAALLIEGLQQSIGVQWSNETVQQVIACLIAFRVLFVVILMAREGYKLGKLMQKSAQEQGNTEETPRSHQEEETQETPGELPIVNTRKPRDLFPRKQGGIASGRVYKVLKGNPAASISEIMNKAKVSRGYASKIRTQYLQEIAS